MRWIYRSGTASVPTGPYILAAAVLLPAVLGVGVLDWAVSPTLALLEQIAPGASAN